MIKYQILSLFSFLRYLTINNIYFKSLILGRFKIFIVFFIFYLSVLVVNGEDPNDKDSLIENDTTNLLFNDIDQSTLDISASKTLLWGPGLSPQEIVLPARYFYIHFVSKNGNKLNSSKELFNDLKVRIDCNGDRQVWTQILDRRDGSFIIRYKSYQSCVTKFRIITTYKGHHLGKSPYIFSAPVHPDSCNCPELEAVDWLSKMKCPEFGQIQSDLSLFPNKSVDFELVLSRVIEKFFHPASHSFCHYAIVNNQIYRKCYGQHVGFHIFPDSILLSLTRKLYLPNLEFIINLGDWPLVQKQRVRPPLPIFSWCKSNETLDILLPTYELTEASLEGMGRVSLDMMTVQANSEIEWDDKIPKIFWRGRDSRQERLDLIQLGRKHPELFNVSLTNFFFFRDKEGIYGPKEPHISFFKFFNYKYQLNVDGTVAAYRFPFLLGGDSLVFKTDSPYIEHFYSELRPWIHYIPIKAHYEDLVAKLNWAIENDAQAKKISLSGRKYAQEHLMPLNILCYHVRAYTEWSYRLKNPVVIHPGMEPVPQAVITPPNACDCSSKARNLQEAQDEKVEL